MIYHKDEYGNMWERCYSVYQLKIVFFKKETDVWYRGIPNCQWTTPHISHKISVKEYLYKFDELKNDTWILINNDFGISDTIKVALITGIFSIMVALINKNPESYIPQSESINIQQVNGDGNITFTGNQNTVLLTNHNNDWEWEDLKNVKGNDTLSIRVVYKILTDQFRWKFGSYEQLDNGKSVSIELPKYLNSLPDFHKAIGLISVGMASEEGDINVETDRADRRCDNILLALNPSSIAVDKDIYKLNLGQHKRTDGKKGEATSFQRKIILIGVMSWTGNGQISDLESSLKEALKGSEGLSFPTNSYSNFKLTTYKIDYRRKTYKN